MSKEYTFKEVEISVDALKEVSKLLSLSFPLEKKFTTDFLIWQYDQNPIGKIVGYNAYHENNLVGHYVAMPIQMQFGNTKRKGLLSLNTATHPQHQGKGLFTQLASMTYELAKANKFEFVIGVANANSFTGFVNKLGFKSIGKLQAKLGFGKIIREKKPESTLSFRIWDKESINWRLNNPSNKYFISDGAVFSKTDKSMISAYLFESPIEEQNTELTKAEATLLKLWIGNDPEVNWRKSKYYSIPNFLRPSPLQLIYKELGTSDFNITHENIKFSLSDFDAY